MDWLPVEAICQFWRRLTAMWASPKRVAALEKKVDDLRGKKEAATVVIHGGVVGSIHVGKNGADVKAEAAKGLLSSYPLANVRLPRGRRPKEDEGGDE